MEPRRQYGLASFPSKQNKVHEYDLHSVRLAPLDIRKAKSKAKRRQLRIGFCQAFLIHKFPILQNASFHRVNGRFEANLKMNGGYGAFPRVSIYCWPNCDSLMSIRQHCTSANQSPIADSFRCENGITNAGSERKFVFASRSTLSTILAPMWRTGKSQFSVLRNLLELV